MSNNNFLPKLCLFGACYGIIRNEIYHKYTLYTYYDKKDRVYKYENHTITRRIGYGLFNMLLCQPIFLPFIMFDDLNTFEKYYKGLHLDIHVDSLPYINYIWKK